MTERYAFPGAPVTEREREVLEILQEECAEVVQASSKLLRFGQENYPGYGDNQEQLGLEIGDLLELIYEALASGIVTTEHIAAGRKRKREKLKVYTRYV